MKLLKSQSWLLLALLLILVPSFSGCVAGSVVEVPLPRIGDKVEFREEYRYGNGNIRTAVTELSVEKLELVQLPDGTQAEAVQVREEWEQGDWNGTNVHYIDLESFGLIKSITKCAASNISGSCAPISHTYEAHGAPWAFGSSLFQGNTISSTSSVQFPVYTGGTATQYEAQVDDRLPGGRFQVSVRPLDPAALSLQPSKTTTGTFVISEDNPYVHSAEMGWYHLDPTTQEEMIHSEATIEQVRFDAGEGPTIRWTEKKPIWSRCLDPEGMIENMLPPGSDHHFTRFNSSFREFVDYLIDHDEPFAQHSKASGAFVGSLEFSGRTTFTIGDPVVVAEDMKFTATIEHHPEHGTLRWTQVEKKSRSGMLSVEQNDSYEIIGKGIHPSVFPPAMEFGQLVSIPALASAHEERAETGSFSPRLSSEPVFDQEGDLLRVDLRLAFIHAGRSSPDGQPQNFRIYEYSFATGCLVQYEPGVRNSLD